MAFLLHQLLSESAKRFPDNIALIFERQSVTYSELEKQANKLAFELLRQGVMKGSRIGIHMNRGITSVMSACAILKTGAVYVPIDPMAPLGRLQFIISKCGINTLITVQDRLKTIEEAFPEDSPLETILVMDGIDPGRRTAACVSLISGLELPDPVGEKSPCESVVDSDLAYILFTSGSTGNPKGVMISHLNSLTFVNSAHDFFRITQEDRLSNNSPLHFDLSIL